MVSMTIEEAVALAASNTFGVTEADILSRRRGDRWVCEARKVAMLLLHRSGWTPARIGLYMGRHRTTVLHALGLRNRAAQAGRRRR